MGNEAIPDDLVKTVERHAAALKDVEIRVLDTDIFHKCMGRGEMFDEVTKLMGINALLHRLLTRPELRTRHLLEEMAQGLPASIEAFRRGADRLEGRIPDLAQRRTDPNMEA